MMWEEKIFYERRDAKAEGREEERLRVVAKKLEKGKSPEQIADELEISVDEAEAYIRKLQENANF